MKKLIFLITIILFFSNISLQAQNGLYDLRFSVKNYNCANKVATIAVQVKATEANRTYLMGDANYRFDFDPRQMRNPRIVSQENFSNLAPANDANYLPQNLNGTSTGTTIGTVSLNTFYSGALNSAKRVQTDWLTIACIAFDVMTDTSCFRLRWHSDTEFPITGMSEVELLANGEYNLYIANSSKFFGNVESCEAKNCGNTPPVVNLPNSSITKQDSFVNICGSILDNTPLSMANVSICEAPKFGTATPSVFGNQMCLRYKPNAGFYGVDSVCIRVCDAQGACVEKKIAINVNPTRVANPCDLDKTPPVITTVHPRLAGVKNGDTLVFDCANPVIFDENSVTATDNSGKLQSLLFVDIIVRKGVYPVDDFKLFMECDWIATDSCGNETRFKIFIKIKDTKAPIFANAAPADTTILLHKNQTVPSAATFTATDDCGNATVVFAEKRDPLSTNGCDYRLTRTWTATDEMGNKTTQTQVVTVKNEINVVATTKPEVCDTRNGSITLMPTAGLTFRWSDGTTAAQRTGLASGAYDVTVSDAMGCTQILTIAVADTCGCDGDKIAPQLTFNNPALNGRVNGDTLTTECGAPMNFTAADARATDNASAVSAITFAERAISATLKAYSWTASDACGNATTLTIFVKTMDTTAPTFSNAPADVTVNRNNGEMVPAAATLTATDICSAVVVDMVETKTALGMDCDSLITRTWTATDASGNQAQRVQKITVKNSVMASFQTTPSVCGASDGMLTFSPGTLTYTWADGFKGAQRAGLKAGSYTVTVSNGMGCSRIYTATIQDACPCTSFIAEETMLKVTETCGATNPVCFNVKKDKIRAYYDNNVFNTTGMTTCGDGNLSLALSVGVHQIVLVNQAGCTDTVTVKVACIRPETRIFEMRVGQQDTTCLDLSELLGTRFTAKNVKFTNADIAAFSLNAGTSCIEMTALRVGEAKATYIATDETGIADTTHLIVRVSDLDRTDKDREIVIFNGFSPNGDGTNDRFTIKNAEKYADNQLEIFNRWGNKIYFKKGYQNDWDGTWNSQNVPDGTYFYLFQDGEGKTYSGYVQILR